MIIRSMAGDFEITVDTIEREGDDLVVVGRMGVWDARTYLTARDVLRLVGQICHLRILVYALRIPILLLRSRRVERRTKE